MENRQLFLVGANKSRPSGRWSVNDFDVLEAKPNGRTVGRIYKLSVAPAGNRWFWALNPFPAVPADSGTAETREAAMDAFKTQWLRRRSG